ncbi:MAG: phosphonate metabolism protein/1,5-bisphosphokinase (PRPP-forming) PhnN [Rudanella sp.]|nr:phosphonate metabolism protein/1,5-bisphosphokinase (PRPP-forming) PhnN [Rudanella sp.]
MPEGTLFYVIGPSGAGKDSLMAYARQQIDGRLPVLFTHRYITRPMDAGGENHVELSVAEFQKRRDLGLFALDWQSHQNYYGIGIEIINWLSAGINVVVNGSREYLPTATERFPQMRVVLITVSPDVLRQRLTDRGRETPAEIDARIERSRQIAPVAHPNLILLSNDAPLAESGARFVALLSA